tara:strand:- start:14654 stop:14959 length:306 start_codon:yes stop_codon:yes gene_type:complete
MKLRPVNDKIVVKSSKKEEVEKTAGGIILPDTVTEGTLLKGTVVAASEGMYSAQGTMIPLVVKEGDTVLYSKHAAVSEHTLDGEEFVLMSVNEVMSVVEDE